MHLLIPFASATAPACELAARSLRLPHLEKLLGRLSPAGCDAGAENSLSPPHERALARCLALPVPDGAIAWAAREAAAAGHGPGQDGWAWITPAYWEVGRDHIRMHDPGTLALTEPESRALLQAMSPYFAQDGITLLYAAPTRWLARGAVFAALASASLDRVAGREISAWMPSAPMLRRLQNEMQMLLYTHPVNDVRAARGLPSVNSFWVSGSGTLPVAATTVAEPALQQSSALRAPALAGDWPAWAQAWATIDQHDCKALLERLDAGQDVRLTLCGERHARGFASTRTGWLGRLQRRLAPTTTLHDLVHLL